MKMITYALVFVVVVYLAIGLWSAITWSRNYDAERTSAPNSAASFIINTFTWPL